MKDSERIQMVINTLEKMEIRATFDNCNMMLGMFQTLAQVRDRMKDREAEENAGNADAE